MSSGACVGWSKIRARLTLVCLVFLASVFFSALAPTWAWGDTIEE